MNLSNSITDSNESKTKLIIIHETDKNANTCCTGESSKGKHSKTVLLKTLSDAQEKQQKQHVISKELEEAKVQLHKEIHNQALSHNYEIKEMEDHVKKLANEICALRADAKKKDKIFDSLILRAKAHQEAFKQKK